MSPAHKLRLAGAAAGARACDSCISLDARWHCTSDDAFLCDKCDASVHAANSLARRHLRLSLKTSASEPIPAWHKGFKRKPRTPRPRHHVPELESSSADETEFQLIYRVPIFETKTKLYSPLVDKPKPSTQPNNTNVTGATATAPFTEMDLAEFAADMESLLAPELHGESFCMEELGLMESSKTAPTTATGEDCVGHAIKVEAECTEIETLDFNFDCESPAMAGEEYEGKPERAVRLRLNYEAVIAEWSMHGLSPWTEGTEMVGCSWMGGEVWNGSGVEIDGGREARVLRYREKRRTRLFAKKIRYEVRKVNAEKRPRMKGRFVKRPEGKTSMEA